MAAGVAVGAGEGVCVGLGVGIRVGVGVDVAVGGGWQFTPEHVPPTRQRTPEQLQSAVSTLLGSTHLDAA